MIEDRLNKMYKTIDGLDTVEIVVYDIRIFTY